MIIDGSIPFDRSHTDIQSRAIRAFLDFLEKKLNVRVLIDNRAIPFGRIELLEEFSLAEVLRKSGVIQALYKRTSLPDEPPIHRWTAAVGGASGDTGGASLWNESDAIKATLAEALERYLWTEATDYMIKPLHCSISDMAKKHAFLSPKRFAGFSQKQRDTSRALHIDDSSSFLWTKGFSLVEGRPVYIPVQTVQGTREMHKSEQVREPLIRTQITTGLATWRSEEGATYRGMLEIIERDAYMIMWLNQLHLPRIDLTELSARDERLRKAIEICDRYRFRIHAIRLLTDAPAYAMCVCVEDLSQRTPHLSFGLKAHRSLARAIEGALLEALRARYAPRANAMSGHAWDNKISVRNIGHRDRLDYWADPDNARILRPFIETRLQESTPESWDNDSETDHRSRILKWCRESGYECAHVALGTSRLNKTSLFVNSVVIPELQPTHVHENLPSIGGKRLTSIPKKFGYTPLPKPYTERPHPFS